MRRCLRCDARFANTRLACPQCLDIPPIVDGFVAFASELIEDTEGFSVDSHQNLDAAQETSFWFRERNLLIASLLRKYFPKARSLLEVGCGTGYVLSGLHAAAELVSLSGSEIHTAGLTFAKRRLGSEAMLMQMDARNVPFVDEFDVVAAFDVLEHIAEDEAVLAQMAHAVKPGGGLLLSVPQHPFLWSKTDEIAHHKRRYRRGELAAKVRAAGLEVLAQTSFVSTLLPTMMLQRLTSGRRKDYTGADEFALPVWLDRSFGAFLRFERMLIAMDIPLPVGGSRFVVARRRADITGLTP